MPDKPSNPAYRIETSRLVLRCWKPADAPLLKAAIDTSLDHLRRWILWAADEPKDMDVQIQRLRRFRGSFDLDKDYVYGILTTDEETVVGGTGLHTRAGPEALEIGYWIVAGFLRQGLATEAVAALTRVAFEVHGVRRVEIRCDPDNEASAAIPRKLGFRHEATLRAQLPMPDGSTRDVMLWTLLADEYPGSPSAGSEICAFDAAGRRIL